MVGIDPDLMHALARDLGVDLEITRINLTDAASVMDKGQLDIVVGGSV